MATEADNREVFYEQWVAIFQAALEGSAPAVMEESQRMGVADPEIKAAKRMVDAAELLADAAVERLRARRKAVDTPEPA